MNNATTSINITTAAIEVIIQENLEAYVYVLSALSCTVLILYAALLKLGQEVEFIWFKSFSWPTLLYFFTRYGVLFSTVFSFWSYYVPQSGRVCILNDIVGGVFATVGIIGAQGLLVARAYCLIGGHRIVSKVFIFMLLSETILDLAANIIFDVCTGHIDGTSTLLLLLTNISVVFMDLLVSGICMWKIWGTWKLGHQAGIRNSSSLSSILVKQHILRCFFVAVITIATTILIYRSSNNDIANAVSFYHNVLSSIMVADFTLELRRQNSARIEASNISLSSIRFSNILENIQQSILVEMSTPNPEVEGPDGDRGNIPATIQTLQGE